jgi:hypothetical protein
MTASASWITDPSAFPQRASPATIQFAGLGTRSGWWLRRPSATDPDKQSGCAGHPGDHCIPQNHAFRHLSGEPPQCTRSSGASWRMFAGCKTSRRSPQISAHACTSPSSVTLTPCSVDIKMISCYKPFMGVHEPQRWPAWWQRTTDGRGFFHSGAELVRLPARMT